MDFSKLKNRLLIVLCVFIVLFPFWCVRGLCAEIEDVEINSANLSINSSRNYFVTSDTTTVGYFTVEKGYIYHMHNKSSTSERLVATSDSSPAVNVSYTIIATIPINGDYDYIAQNDSNVYISYSASSQVSVTREKISSMDSTISDLVNNVGLNNLWGVFNISINYIIIVVLFAFGFFIIVALIKKLRKGKGGI